MEATHLGVPGGESDLDDLSPDGYAHHAEIARATLARLDEVEPVDEVDRVTVAAMRERLGLTIEDHEAGYDRMQLNVLASPLQGCRDVFDLMPTATQDDWATIATRLTKVPTALAQWTATLRGSADRGLVTPRRQVTRVHHAVRPAHGARRLLRHLRRQGERRRRTPRRRRAGRSREGRRGRGHGLPAARRGPRHPPARPRTRGRRRGARALPARLAPLPRRHRRPRGDLRLGPGGAGAHHGRHARHRRPDRARRRR